MPQTVDTESPHVIVSAQVAGTAITVARKNLDYEEAELDTYLFEPDYTIAGSTGFLLWPGTFVLIDLLNAGDLAARLHGRKVMELGSGTGLAGLCAAAAGSSVLMTDLPSVVHGILDANTKRNGASGHPAGIDACDPSSAGFSASEPWLGSLAIGSRGGSACCAALDWSEPLKPQVCGRPQGCHVE